jgi:hypothetical protein
VLRGTGKKGRLASAGSLTAGFRISAQDSASKKGFAISWVGKLDSLTGTARKPMGTWPWNNSLSRGRRNGVFEFGVSGARWS